MLQLKDYADNRLFDGCIYCGGQSTTRDHVPSRVLLDRPLPTNLPVLPACLVCNNGFSSDEEYVACLLEAVMVGSTEPNRMERRVIADILQKNPMLRSRIEAAKRTVSDQVAFDVEVSRITNVLLKLARGHAAYELSTLCREEPSLFKWGPLSTLTDIDRELLEEVHVAELLGEVGSRGMQRLLVTQLILESPNGERSAMGLLVSDWIEVQTGRYRYIAYDDYTEVRVRIVLGEYLYCDVSWNKQTTT